MPVFSIDSYGLKKDRIAGLFRKKPFDRFQASPINISEKSVKNTFRLIHDLSYSYNNDSVNAEIPESEKTVKYPTVRDERWRVFQKGCT